MGSSSIYQVIDDMRSGGVPPRIAEPFPARRHVASHNTGRVRHTAVAARMLREVPLPVLVTFLVPRLLEIQAPDPGGERVHRGAGAGRRGAGRGPASVGGGGGGLEIGRREIGGGAERLREVGVVEVVGFVLGVEL